MKKSRSKITLKGIPASNGIGKGCPIIIENPLSPENECAKENFVLVVPYATPQLTLLMIKASAIVTEKGGIVSHAAIIAREMGIPCVVNVESCLEKLRNVNFVLVDGNKGVVYGYY
ncbi:MAG: PEP-utilizing enzyme [Nitrososphaeria archaeon]